MSQKENIKPNTNAYKVASLTLGILSILTTLFYYITYPCGILAIIFGAKSIKNENSAIGRAGLVLGIVGVSIATILYLFMITYVLIN